MSERSRAWALPLALAGCVLVLGLAETLLSDTTFYASRSALFLVVLGMAGAVAIGRALPSVALLLVWLVCGMQVLTGTSLLLVQACIGFVAFATARWGSPATIVASLLSIPLATAAGLALIGSDRVWEVLRVSDRRDLIRLLSDLGDTWLVGAGVAAMAVLGAPWLIGLTLRFNDRARHSRASQEIAEQQAAQAHVESEQAREIARLRDEQMRLTRDVHDVVGHSLAVILAQAESAQYLPDDPVKLRETMTKIAGSARTSLQEVRQVLSATGRDGRPATPGSASPVGDLDRLVEGVRSSGHEVVSTVAGTVQPLPPELATVAFRVLQEMLTNAIRHGRRDAPVLVERHWPDGQWQDELRIEVRNAMEQATSRIASDPPSPAADGAGDLTQPLRVVSPETSPAPPVPAHGPRTAPRRTATAPGQGLEGMRRRLEAVGGRLDVRRRDSPDGPTFTATAWIPVRG